MNRYANATSEEKALFTAFAKELGTHTGLGVEKRMLRGEKGRQKFIFALKKNNPYIHSLEFGTKNGEVDNIRLVTSRPTLKSDFYKSLLKGKGVCDAKASYGGIVVHFDTTLATANEVLKFIDKLALASEVIELDTKRTYCDPPAEWIEGNDGRIGVVKAEKKAKEVKSEVTVVAELNAPLAETKIEPTISEEALAMAMAKADLKKAI